MLLDFALSQLDGTSTIPGYDCMYDPLIAFLDKFIEALNKNINIFDMIKAKDDKILTEYMSVLLPKNPYTDKIQYIYGANPERRKYVDNDSVVGIWKLINALTDRAIKWVIATGVERYSHVINLKMVEKYRINMDI